MIVRVSVASNNPSDSLATKKVTAKFGPNAKAAPGLVLIFVSLAFQPVVGKKPLPWGTGHG